MQPNTPNIFNSDLLNREEARAREAAARRRNSVDPGPSNMRALVEMLRSYSEDVPQQSPSLAPDQSPSPASARTQYAALSPDPQLQWWQRQERLPHPQQWPPPMLEPEPEQEQSGRSLTPENRPKFNSLAYNEYISNAESGNNPKLINTYHNPFRSTAGGSYGLTKAALQDVGKKNEYFRDKSIENLTYEQQTEAHNIFTEINRQRLKDRNIFDSFPQYDEHNLLSAAHLLGPSGLERFLTRGSFSKAAQDANGGRVNLRNIVLKRLNQSQPALYREGGKVKKPQSDSRWFIPSKPAKPALDLTYEPSSADDTEKNTYEEMLEYLKEQGIRINEDDSDSSDSPNETLSFVQQIDSEHERLEPSDPQNVVEVNLPKVRFMIDPRKSIRGPSGQATIGFVRDFAEGGLVKYDPDTIDQLAQEFIDSYQEGGLVKYDPDTIDQLAQEFIDSYQEGGEVVGIEPPPTSEGATAPSPEMVEAEKILVPQRFQRRPPRDETLAGLADMYDVQPKWDERRWPTEGYPSIVPFRKTPEGKTEFVTPTIIRDMINFYTAPRRSMDDPDFDEKGEALNAAMNLVGAGPASRLVKRVPPGLLDAPPGSLTMNVPPGIRAKEVTVAPPVPAYERQLSPLGFYSHGAETAANLAQAKGTPDQMAAMLRKYGVKPDEFYNTGIADETATNVMRSKIERDYAPKLAAAKLEMDALGLNENTINKKSPDYNRALEIRDSPETKTKYQYDRTLSAMRSEMDSAMVLRPEWASRPSVTRDELAKHFNERRPQIEETVLGKNIKSQPYPEEYTKIEQDIQNRYWGEIRKLRSVHLDKAEPWSVRTEAANKALALYDEMDLKINEAIPNREALIQAARTTPTKFHNSTLPGGKNYREVLLKLPERIDEAEAIYKQMRAMSDGVPNATISPEYKALLNQYNEVSRPLFRSTHWDGPNVLAHLRMSDRTGPNGERILHLEELQSDWGQKGRTGGFGNRQEVDLKPLEADLELVKAALMKIDHNIAKRESGGKFNSSQEILDSNYLDLYYRIRVARRADSEFIAANEAFNAAAHALREARMNNRSNTPTAPYVTNTAAWTDLALKRALKEAAEGGYDKIVWTPGAEQAKRYGLIDKKREGMMNYYDNIVPNQLSKLVKRLDPEAKVGMGRMPVRGRNVSGEDIARELGMSYEAVDALPHAEKMALIKSVRRSIAAPSLTITPKMREAIMKGQTDFAEGGLVEPEKVL